MTQVAWVDVGPELGAWNELGILPQTLSRPDRYKREEVIFMKEVIETNITLYEDVPLEATEFIQLKPWTYKGQEECWGYKFSVTEQGIDIVNDPDIEVHIDVEGATTDDVENMVWWFDNEDHRPTMTHFEPVSHDDAEDIEVRLRFTFTHPYYDGDKGCMITKVDEIEIVDL